MITGKGFQVRPEQAGVTWCGQLELSDGDSVVGPPFDRRFARARLLIRIHDQPVGFVHLPLPNGRLEPQEAIELASAELGGALEEHLSYDRSRGSCELADDDPTPVTVVVCTRNRAALLGACLEALRRLTHSALEVVVVDNAPRDDSTLLEVRRAAGDDKRFRYVLEPKPGLSRARNRGLAEANGHVIAYTDDDVRVDPLWVRGLLVGFRRRSDVACTTGLVATSSLRTSAEQYFDARVSWSASCHPQLFNGVGSERFPGLYPYAAGLFGTGANMAFRTTVLRSLGGFDESLGAGSLAGGGEDLDAFVRLLRRGHALAYEPVALTWHEHRSADADLRRQMYAYGKGLGAYLTKYVSSPRSRRDILSRLPAGLAHMRVLSDRSVTAEAVSGGSRSLMLSEVAGLAAGPFAYGRAWWKLSPEHRRRVRP